MYNVEYRTQTTREVVLGTHQADFKSIERDGARLGALVLKPLVIGAGFIIFVDPLLRHVLADIERGQAVSSSSSAPSLTVPYSTSSWTGVPVIFDDLFAGPLHLGVQSAALALDIAVYAKNLTGNFLPFAATLASDGIFDAFLSDSKADALLHGHSYSAHAVGCAVTNEALTQIDTLRAVEEARVWGLWGSTSVKALSKHDMIAKVSALSTMLSVKVPTDQGGYVSHSAQELLKGLEDVKRAW